MALDFATETAIQLSDVPRYVPKRRGKKVHYSTVYRWATKGARGRLLETVRSGGIRYTTVEEVGRFLSSRPMMLPNDQDNLSAVIEAALLDAGI